MLNALFLGYVTAVVAAFVGAVFLPRVRWLLLVLGALGILVPLAGIIVLLAYLDTAEIHFG